MLSDDTPLPLLPKQIVHELDRHIIGQQNAKRAVAIALRNRWRRMQLSPELRDEVSPKNILMIGPTGVGKTEIARRLAKLANAPLIKVEATKFTEVGYVGRDVESIVRDLLDVSINMLRQEQIEAISEEATDKAEERILDALLPEPRSPGGADSPQEQESNTRQMFRKKLREGQLDEKEIEIDVEQVSVGVEIMAPPGMEEMTNQLQNMFSNLSSGRRDTKRLKIADARRRIKDEEAAALINEEDLKTKAIQAVEQTGIVFLDELDKVAKRGEHGGADVSREGVQRDLLPLIEGSTVSTKHGPIKTDHILFIACGAFHLAKPSDLIPELQGRLPIRVELQGLNVTDFEQILTEPRASLCYQYTELLKIEGVKLNFDPSGIRRIAELAWQVNEGTENIGARRLHTVMERLLESLSFDASDGAQEAVTIDRNYVDEQLADLVSDTDVSRFIL